jgi:dipeptidyl aminopeptidase/acylaminoacyl peptidase
MQGTPFFPDLSIRDPAFSADGKWMVVIRMHSWESILWRARSDGSEWLQLTDSRLFPVHARFSPDGKRTVMMARWPEQPWKIYWVATEGGALHELNVPITSQADPNWMPDNQSILFDALTAVEVCQIRPKDFRNVVKTNPVIGITVLRTLSEEVSDLRRFMS